MEKLRKFHDYEVPDGALFNEIASQIQGLHCIYVSFQ